MDQRYIDTVRACKVILHNLDHLDESATFAQRTELERLLLRVIEHMSSFLEAGAHDEGLWIGEE